MSSRYNVLKNERLSLLGRGANQHEHLGLAFETMAPVLGIYFRALAGRNVALLPYGNDQDPKQYPDTNTTVRLPARISRFPDNLDNFAWYKVALTHRAAHYEGGTFGFSFWRPAAHYERLRPQTLGELQPFEHESDLELFFRLFAQRALAIEIFTVLEDLRLDAWAKHRYPGLRPAFEEIEKDALAERPVLQTLRPRDALAEVMVRLSLNSNETFEVPVLLHDFVRRLVRVVAPLRTVAATAEDTAEAALRAYSLITRMPNLAADYGEATHVDLAAPCPPHPWPTAWPEPERTHLEGDEVMETAIQPVSYRDRLGSRYAFYRGAGPLDQQAIYRFTNDGNARRAAMTLPTSDTPADAEVRPAGPPEPLPHDHHDHFGEDPQHHEKGELHSHETSWYIYPEWDHVKGDYRRNWCCVRESQLDAAESARFYMETLQVYGGLVPEIRRQFERLSNEGLRKVRRTLYGDELDLDACVEAMIDLKAGITPSDHVYVSREPVARDVALALLLDMSASTADHVEPSSSGDAYRATTRRLHGKSYRTILDIEKESVVLLMAALERLGDSYGIYCFSGTGREDVKFKVLKGMNEPLSERVAARIENIKPIHTTRMGAAVRHAVRKLHSQEAKTKVLLLVSDGRPFDLDYGQEYGDNAEIDYAVHDTRQALQEAQRVGVEPFILTIDQNGADYLRVMCEDLNYEILTDVNLLPARLLALYRTLTA
jgi:nitric oxide reductase NorD protein